MSYFMPVILILSYIACLCISTGGYVSYCFHRSLSRGDIVPNILNDKEYLRCDEDIINIVDLDKRKQRVQRTWLSILSAVIFLVCIVWQVKEICDYNNEQQVELEVQVDRIQDIENIGG